MPTKKELIAEGFSEEQIDKMIEKGLNIEQDPTVESLTKELEDTRNALKKANKEAENYRHKSKELDSLKAELESKLNEQKEVVDTTLTDKERQERQLQELNKQMDEFRKMQAERDEIASKLEAFETKENQRKEALLQKLPEEKRDKFKNADIEIIEEFINNRRNSSMIEREQVQSGSMIAQSIQDRAKAPYRSNIEKPNFINL